MSVERIDLVRRSLDSFSDGGETGVDLLGCGEGVGLGGDGLVFEKSAQIAQNWLGINRGRGRTDGSGLGNDGFTESTDDRGRLLELTLVDGGLSLELGNGRGEGPDSESRNCEEDALHGEVSWKLKL